MNETIERIHLAQEVAEARTRDFVLDRADSVLEGLLGKHLMGQLTDRDAAVGVAVIAELRRVAGRAQRVVQQGIEAGESLTRKQP